MAIKSQITMDNDFTKNRFLFDRPQIYKSQVFKSILTKLDYLLICIKYWNYEFEESQYRNVNSFKWTIYPKHVQSINCNREKFKYSK